MRKWLLRLLWVVPLIAALLAVGAYFVVGAWLESAGGRRALEAALGERLGVPVSLAGEFNVMLLPQVGVDGSELFIGAPGEATEIAYARDFAVALALRPLLDKQLVVDSVYLSGGRFYPERWPVAEGSADSGVVSPPEIRALEIEDIDVVTGANESDSVGLQRLRVDDFRAGVDTPFELGVDDYGDFEGQFRWDGADASLTLTGEWSGWLPGRTALELRAGFGEGAGSVAASWDGGGAAALPESRLAIRLRYALVDSFVTESSGGGARIDNLRLEAGDQFVEGAGCVRFGAPARVDFELRSPRVDLDRLPDLGPFLDVLDAGDKPAVEAPDASGPAVALNLRLRAGEARGQGAVAYDAMFLLGEEPDCAESPAAGEAPGMTVAPVTVQ